MAFRLFGKGGERKAEQNIERTEHRFFSAGDELAHREIKDSTLAQNVRRGVQCDERRGQICGGRSVGNITADGRAVADLRGADGGSRLCDHAKSAAQQVGLLKRRHRAAGTDVQLSLIVDCDTL
mgnify:CR=1 FL=1